MLGTGASRALPGISIGWTAIVVVRTPYEYIWSYVSVLLYRWDFGLGNRTRDMLPVFWSPHQGAGPFLLDLQFQVAPKPPGARKTLRKNPLVLTGIRTQAAWLAIQNSTYYATSLLQPNILCYLALILFLATLFTPPISYPNVPDPRVSNGFGYLITFFMCATSLYPTGSVLNLVRLDLSV